MAKKFTRMDGETMPQFQARIAEIQASERKPYEHLIGRSRQRARVRHEQRTYPDADGRDFDNLGLSPDY